MLPPPAGPPPGIAYGEALYAHCYPMALCAGRLLNLAVRHAGQMPIKQSTALAKGLSSLKALLSVMWPQCYIESLSAPVIIFRWSAATPHGSTTRNAAASRNAPSWLLRASFRWVAAYM